MAAISAAKRLKKQGLNQNVVLIEGQSQVQEKNYLLQEMDVVISQISIYQRTATTETRKRPFLSYHNTLQKK